MPSRLRSKNGIPVDTLELDGGDWVKVRRWLTAADRDEMNHRMTKIDPEAGTGTVSVEMANRNTALQVLVGWGGPGLCVDDHADDDGNPLEAAEGHQHMPVEITFENVSMLHDSDLRQIIQHVTRKNPKAVAPAVDGPFREAIGAGMN